MDVVSLCLNYDLLKVFVCSLCIFAVVEGYVLHVQQWGGLTTLSIHCALQRLKALALGLEKFYVHVAFIYLSKFIQNS